MALRITALSSVCCRHGYKLKNPVVVLFVGNWRQDEEQLILFGLPDSCTRVIFVCRLFVLDSTQWRWGPGDTLELVTMVKAGAALWRCGSAWHLVLFVGQ